MNMHAFKAALSALLATSNSCYTREIGFISFQDTTLHEISLQSQGLGIQRLLVYCILKFNVAYSL